MVYALRMDTNDWVVADHLVVRRVGDHRADRGLQAADLEDHPVHAVHRSFSLLLHL